MIAASRFLTYPGDVRVGVFGRVVGPTLQGEILTAVSADYDEAANTTRVGFAYGDQRMALRAVEHELTN